QTTGRRGCSHRARLAESATVPVPSPPLGLTRPAIGAGPPRLWQQLTAWIRNEAPLAWLTAAHAPDRQNTVTSFADLGIDQDIIDALAGKGIVDAFPIQEQTIPLGLP